MKNLDIAHIRSQFPFFKNNPTLSYFDSAATALKPQVMLDAMNEYDTRYSVNIKRGVYDMSAHATAKYEQARSIVASFLHATPEETVFVRNATEGLNLIMYALGTEIIQEGDEIVTSIIEHHSNFVPWQQLVGGRGATLRIIDIDDDTHRLSIFDEQGNVAIGDIISPRTKILALTHVSNVLGAITPLKEIIAQARRINPEIVVVVDGAQAVPHIFVDVSDLDCDFYVFSGHKLYGPTGIGVVWGRMKLWNTMVPFMYGGDMIERVEIDRTTFAAMPEKYEAGTPAIAQAIGLGAAITFLQDISHTAITAHIDGLVAELVGVINSLEGFRMHQVQDPHPHVGVVTLSHVRAHAHDIASILDEHGVQVRAGHHCAMPLHTRLGLASTVRFSFGMYVSEEDVKKAAHALAQVNKIFTK